MAQQTTSSPSQTGTAEELQPSELGTQEYWSSAYAKELDNYLDHGDRGEVWFGESNERRITRWIAKNFPSETPVVDIGCGNGHLLIQLATEYGFKNLTGIDYVEEALALARKVAAEERVEAHVRFKVGNLLAPDTNQLERHTVVVDKGTYDAICLMPGMNDEKRRAYISSVKQMLARSESTNTTGTNTHEHAFIITSCNWTKEELLAHFHQDFSLVEELPTPTISFGGKQGKTVTSLIFNVKY